MYQADEYDPSVEQCDGNHKVSGDRREKKQFLMTRKADKVAGSSLSTAAAKMSLGRRELYDERGTGIYPLVEYLKLST